MKEKKKTRERQEKDKRNIQTNDDKKRETRSLMLLQIHLKHQLIPPTATTISSCADSSVSQYV